MMIEGLLFITSAITDMGDSGGLTLVVMLLSCSLLICGNRREALVFAGAFIITSLGVTLCKVLLMGCGSYLSLHGLRSPSGHAALSITVFGILALLIGHHLPEKHRFVPMGLLMPLAFLIALSRVILKFHTVQEVVVGAAIGLLVCSKAAHLLHGKKAAPFNPYALGYIAVSIIYITHGYRLPAENLIQLFAGYFRSYSHCT